MGWRLPTGLRVRLANTGRRLVHTVFVDYVTDAVRGQPALPPNSFAPYHPRILINRDLNLAALRQRARLLDADFQSVVRFLHSDNGLPSNPCAQTENSLLTIMMSFAYAYQMTGQAEYADHVIDAVLAPCYLPEPDGTDGPAFALEAAALVFDWTYDRIVQRDLKGKYIRKLKKIFQATARQEDFAHHIRESDFHNYTVEFENAWLITGLALYGEDSAADAMIRLGWGVDRARRGFPAYILRGIASLPVEGFDRPHRRGHELGRAALLARDRHRKSCALSKLMTPPGIAASNCGRRRSPVPWPPGTTGCMASVPMGPCLVWVTAARI